jgi:hypothetical protein
LNGLPYGFFPHQGLGNESHSTDLPPNAPVYIDINQGAAPAMNTLKYVLENNNYFDEQVKKVTYSLVVYNAMTNMMGLIKVHTTTNSGGAIELHYIIRALPVELYATGVDYFRACLELLFFFTLVAGVFAEMSEFREFYTAHLEKIDMVQELKKKTDGDPTGNGGEDSGGGARKKRKRWNCFCCGCINGPCSKAMYSYLSSGWNLIDWCNLGLQFMTVFLWVAYAGDASLLNPQLRYDALQRMETRGHMHGRSLELGVGFIDAYRMFEDMERLVMLMDLYLALTVYSVVLMVLRVIKVFDFHPRLGLVTRTLSKASADLYHFLAIFLFVLFSYGTIGHLTFGSTVREFSTFSGSITELLRLLLADLEVARSMVRTDREALVPFVTFYVWSYVLLVSFLLLNVLLAILVDSYATVKDLAEESGSVVSDVWNICRMAVGSLIDKANSNEGKRQSLEAIKAKLEVIARSLKQYKDIVHKPKKKAKFKVLLPSSLTPPILTPPILRCMIGSRLRRWRRRAPRSKSSDQWWIQIGQGESR